MGHARIIDDAFRRHGAWATPGRRLRICELGAGDGSLLLALARRWSARDLAADALLVDRQPLLTAATRDAFARLGWTVASTEAEVLAWLQAETPPVELMLANLFLHHFADAQLAMLLRLAAARTRLFIACEPRRGTGPLVAARLIGLIGCNAVTRHDAAISVRAGFRGQELSALWPATSEGATHEGPAGLFSHCFVGGRDE
jgi:hypothetical protein